MTALFMMATVVLYLGAAIGYARNREWGMCFVLLNYACANVIFAWQAK